MASPSLLVIPLHWFHQSDLGPTSLEAIPMANQLSLWWWRSRKTQSMSMLNFLKLIQFTILEGHWLLIYNTLNTWKGFKTTSYVELCIFGASLQYYKKSFYLHLVPFPSTSKCGIGYGRTKNWNQDFWLSRLHAPSWLSQQKQNLSAWWLWSDLVTMITSLSEAFIAPCRV